LTLGTDSNSFYAGKLDHLSKYEQNLQSKNQTCCPSIYPWNYSLDKETAWNSNENIITDSVTINSSTTNLNQFSGLRADSLYILKSKLPKISDKPVQKEIWNGKDTEKLLNLVKTYKHNWKVIAKKFGKKYTPNYLKNKYNIISGRIPSKRVRFTYKEDLLLAKYVQIYGFNWNRISEFFFTRSGLMLKNRYYSYHRKRGVFDSLVQEITSIENSLCSIDSLEENTKPSSDMEKFLSHSETQVYCNNNFNENAVWMYNQEEGNAIQLLMSHQNDHKETLYEKQQLMAQIENLTSILEEAKAELQYLKNRPFHS